MRLAERSAPPAGRRAAAPSSRARLSAASASAASGRARNSGSMRALGSVDIGGNLGHVRFEVGRRRAGPRVGAGEPPGPPRPARSAAARSAQPSPSRSVSSTRSTPSPGARRCPGDRRRRCRTRGTRPGSRSAGRSVTSAPASAGDPGQQHQLGARSRPGGEAIAASSATPALHSSSSSRRPRSAVSATPGRGEHGVGVAGAAGPARRPRSRARATSRRRRARCGGERGQHGPPRAGSPTTGSAASGDQHSRHSAAPCRAAGRAATAAVRAGGGGAGAAGAAAAGAGRGQSAGIGSARSVAIRSSAGRSSGGPAGVQPAACRRRRRRAGPGTSAGRPVGPLQMAGDRRAQPASAAADLGGGGQPAQRPARCAARPGGPRQLVARPRNSARRARTASRVSIDHGAHAARGRPPALRPIAAIGAIAHAAPPPPRAGPPAGRGHTAAQRARRCVWRRSDRRERRRVDDGRGNSQLRPATGAVHEGQRRAWERWWPELGHEVEPICWAGSSRIDPPAWFGRSRRSCWRSVPEWGSRRSRWPPANPDVDHLAVEVFEPGLAQLLMRITEAGLRNVVPVRGDAVALLARAGAAGLADRDPGVLPGSVAQASPPQAATGPARVRRAGRPSAAPGRHAASGHRLDRTTPRRCARSATVNRCWHRGAEHHGGGTAAPDWRPVTKFEQRARVEGRAVCDLAYRRSFS